MSSTTITIKYEKSLICDDITLFSLHSNKIKYVTYDIDHYEDDDEKYDSQIRDVRDKLANGPKIHFNQKDVKEISLAHAQPSGRIVHNKFVPFKDELKMYESKKEKIVNDHKVKLNIDCLHNDNENKTKNNFTICYHTSFIFGSEKYELIISQSKTNGESIYTIYWNDIMSMSLIDNSGKIAVCGNYTKCYVSENGLIIENFGRNASLIFSILNSNLNTSQDK